jgi:glucose-1-phosphate adenylyltransferase
MNILQLAAEVTPFAKTGGLGDVVAGLSRFLSKAGHDVRIFTHPRFLPGTKVNECSVRYSILSEGSILSGSHIADSIIGVRSVVRSGSVIERSIVMGANTWETLPDGSDLIPIGIGQDCTVRNAIIDFNARIGDGCKLINADGLTSFDGDNYSIRDKIIIVHKNAVIPPGTTI